MKTNTLHETHVKTVEDCDYRMFEKKATATSILASQYYELMITLNTVIAVLFSIIILL